MSEKEQQQPQEEQQRQDSVQSDAFDDDDDDNYGDDPDDFVANQSQVAIKGEQIIPRISKAVYTLPSTVASNKHSVNREIRVRQSQTTIRRRHPRKSDCDSNAGVGMDDTPKPILTLPRAHKNGLEK
jgi:hypothetical protein